MRERGDVGTRVAGAHGPDERERPRRASAGELHEQRHVELGRDDRAGEHDARLRQRCDRGIGRAGLERAREQLGVGDVGRLEHVVRQRAHPLGELRRTREHEVGAGREALLGRAEARRVDQRMRGDVIDAVVDDERGVERVEQHLGLRHVGPQDRPAHAQPAHGSAHERRQQPSS